MNRRKVIHLAVAIFWTLLIIPAMVWWAEALWFIIAASLWANVYAGLAAFEAANDSLTPADKQWLTEMVTRIVKEER